MIIHLILLSCIIFSNYGADDPMVQMLLGRLGASSLGDLAEHVRQSEQMRSMIKKKEITDAIEKDEETKCIQLLQENPDIKPEGLLTLAAATKSHKSLQALINHGCDVNYGPRKLYPLYGAICADDLDGVRILLDAGAELELRDKDGDTALNTACYKGSREIFDLLMERGASVVARSHNQMSSLHRAAFGGHIDIITKLLAQNIPCDVRSKRRATPLMVASAENKLAAALTLLAAGASVHATDRKGHTPLFYAVFGGSVAVMQGLLDHGAQTSVKDQTGITLLHSVVGQKTLSNDYKEKIALLLDAGISIDVLDGLGCTPLHIATCFKHEDAALLLLEKGANPNAVGNDGATPLAIAVQKEQYTIAEKLIEKNADPCVKVKGKSLIRLTRDKNMRNLLKNAMKQRQNGTEVVSSSLSESESEGDDCVVM